MLQRTPTWVTSLPRRDRVRDVVQRALPGNAGGAVVRYKNVLTSMAFYELTRRRPAAARALLSRGATRSLGSASMVADHFTPTYDPWDQRLCLVPDGDLFEALRTGRAHVVTDTIETFTPARHTAGFGAGARRRRRRHGDRPAASRSRVASTSSWTGNGGRPETSPSIAA